MTFTPHILFSLNVLPLKTAGMHSSFLTQNVCYIWVKADLQTSSLITHTLLYNVWGRTGLWVWLVYRDRWMSSGVKQKKPCTPTRSEPTNRNSNQPWICRYHPLNWNWPSTRSFLCISKFLTPVEAASHGDINWNQCVCVPHLYQASAHF